MKYIEEYRNPKAIAETAKALKLLSSRPWTIMEVCGGQTHAIMRFGIHQLIPPTLKLLHGPGCPVCVTPQHIIDAAVTISLQQDVILCTYADMLRVPGSLSDLMHARAQGAKIKTIQSPLEAYSTALSNPDKQVVLFGIGFETTAPGHALVIDRAAKNHIHNFSALTSHVLVPAALEFLLQAKSCTIDGFLAAGHVCTITGFLGYDAIASKYQVPIIVTGFEPLDILQGLYRCVYQLERGDFSVYNQYSRCVYEGGNTHAINLTKQIFTTTDMQWRGIGIIPNSGLAIRKEYAQFDAKNRFSLPTLKEEKSPCISGYILQGIKKPSDCPLFGKECTPISPIGAPMVSTEGACSAYYQFQKNSNLPL